MSSTLDRVADQDFDALSAVREQEWQTPLSVRYEDMLRSAVDWMWESDEQLRFTYVSPPIAHSLGVPAPRLTGCPLFDVIADADEPSAVSLLAATDAYRAFRVEAIALEAGGGRRPRCRLTGTPFYDIAGRFAGYRGTGTLIGRSGSQAEPPRPDDEARGQLMEMLEAALARKDQLELEMSDSGQRSFQARLVAVAHELRTPLGAILGFAETIRDRHFGDDMGRYVEYGGNIHYSAVHMLELVDSLMAMADIEAGERGHASDALDAREVVAGSLSMLNVRAAGAGVNLVNDLPSDLPPVRGERRALRQIILNLLSNAITFTPPGGRAGVSGRRADNGAVEIVVWDTGIGIAENEQAKIFDYAYRVSPAVSGLDRPGSGLGLAISRDLARSMGGDITVDSQPDHGSRFTVRLPEGAKGGG